MPWDSISATSFRRSVTASESVHAAWTTGTRSRGTTNIVRRMHRVRTNVRRSYSASSSAATVRRRLGQAGGGGEEDRRRIGAVQADQVTGQGRDVIDLGAGGEVVAPAEPGAAFGVADVPHRRGRGSGVGGVEPVVLGVVLECAGALGGQDLEVVQRGVDVA